MAAASGPTRAPHPGDHEPRDAGYEARVRASFARQTVMALLGARLARVEPGLVEIELPFRPELAQQGGAFHAGVLGTIADSAGGYAAMTLTPPGTDILTTEYKLHLLEFAAGPRALARGRVVRPGRTLTVCEIEALLERADGSMVRAAWGTSTLIARPLRG